MDDNMPEETEEHPILVAESDESDATLASESEEAIAESQTVSSVSTDARMLDEAQKIALIEALIFAHGEPVGMESLLQVSKLEEAEINNIITTIRERYLSQESGFELVQVAGKYQLRTKPMYGPYIAALRAGKPRRLSAAALETLAIVAYRQPIVKSDVERIRGVDATPTLKTLLERKLIKIVGHQPGVGLPALYGTTEEFLKIFGLTALSDLPTLRDLKELERDPGEIQSAEPDSSQGIETAPQPL